MTIVAFLSSSRSDFFIHFTRGNPNNGYGVGHADGYGGETTLHGKCVARMRDIISGTLLQVVQHEDSNEIRNLMRVGLSV